MEQTSPTWHILGPGSIGCLWAWYFHNARQAATLLLRDDSKLAHYRSAGGITVQDGTNAHHFQTPCVTNAQLKLPISHLLVTTKSFQTVAAVTALEAKLVPDACIVLLQNGMGPAAELAAKLPLARLVCATTTDGATRTSEFNICLAGKGSSLAGPFRLEQFAAISSSLTSLLRSNPALSLIENIRPSLWEKLAINCVINPLTAIHTCTNGALLSMPQISQQLPDLCSEIAAVTTACGHEMTAEQLLGRVREVAQATAANQSSMLQDVIAGRPTEIAQINGYLCEQAYRMGVSTPLNSSLIEKLAQLKLSRDSKSSLASSH